MRAIVISFLLSKILFACWSCGNDEQVYEKLKNELDNCERGLLSKTKKIDNSDLGKTLKNNNEKLEKKLNIKDNIISTFKKNAKIYQSNQKIYKDQIKALKEKIALSDKSKKIIGKKKILNNKYITKIDGLFWQDEPYTNEEQKAYSNNKNNGKVGKIIYANTYCKNLTLGGYFEWKLPTKEQLLNLYKHKSELKYDTNDAFWSLDKKDASQSWIVFFNNRGGTWSIHIGTNFVRCVQ